MSKSSIPIDVQTKALAAQAEKVKLAALAYSALSVAVEDQAQASKDSASVMAEEAAQWQSGVASALHDYITSVGTAADMSKKVVTDSFKGMEDALVNFAKTGKLDFTSLADTVITQLIRMQVQASLSSAATGLSGEGGFLGMIGSLFGGGGGGGGGGTSIPIKFNANGNAFTNSGVHPFASGGAFGAGSVLTSPTYFRFGSGGQFGGVAGEAGPEAAVPLKRMRNGNLGIQMEGGNTPASVTNIVNVTVQGGQDASNTGDIVSAKVVQTMQRIADAQIANSLRLGGALNRVSA